MTEDNRAAQEMAYCTAILAKSGTAVLLRILPETGLTTWTRYPDGGIYDPVSGAQWFYHCHDDSEDLGEHGHFHCFVRPDGEDSAPVHLIAIGVDAEGTPLRLFTVNQWVIGGPFLAAAETNALLSRFNVEMALPDYLVNRWLTALVSRFEAEIIALNHARDAKLTADGRPFEDIFDDRSIEVLSSLSLIS